MRNSIKIVLVGAIALAGAVACSPKESVNPNYNPATGEVATSFVFSVSTANSPMTKQTSANTQATATDAFRGITDARLLSFLRNAPVADGKYITAASSANKNYSLGHVMTNTDATTDQSKSHRIIELALPTETNTLMFYGKAPKSGENADFAQGKIDYLPKVTNSNATDLTQYDFALSRIVDINSSGFSAKYRQYGDLIAAVLNYIMNSSIDADVTHESTTVHATLSWAHYVTISDAGVIQRATKSPLDGSLMCSIGEILGEELSTLATINPGEVRAGSGPAVARTLGDLLVIMNKIHAQAPTDIHEAVAKAVAEEIARRINVALEGTAPSLNWKTKANIMSSTLGYTGAVDQITLVGSTGSELDQYPMIAFNLPAGCSQIAVTTTKSTDTDGQVTTPGTITWSYVGNVQMFDAVGATSCYNVYYPAELVYFGNSPIRVTNEAVTEPEYPQGVANWDADASWTAKNWEKDSHVVSTTRSVAMQYNINYGTALFKSNVKYGAAVLEDNNHAIQAAKNPALAATDEPNAQITVSDNTFKLTGILIGGMPTTVGWDFLPVAGSTYNQAIYDKALASNSIPASGTSADNYTLVWDNWNESKRGGKQNDVYVCLEFQNNSGRDFWGKHNIVRNGGIFYIIGKLDPDAGKDCTTDRSTGVTWPTDGLQALPPFQTDGSTLKERRVFIQDFMTTANFVIGAESLQSAYSTVPDLRSTQISLGLSVDLKWETGLVFENIVLGN